MKMLVTCQEVVAHIFSHLYTAVLRGVLKKFGNFYIKNNYKTLSFFDIISCNISSLPYLYLWGRQPKPPIAEAVYDISSFLPLLW